MENRRVNIGTAIPTDLNNRLRELNLQRREESGEYIRLWNTITEVLEAGLQVIDGGEYSHPIPARVDDQRTLGNVPDANRLESTSLADLLIALKSTPISAILEDNTDA